MFDSISTTKPKRIRKRNGKTLREIDDIICTLKVCDPEEIPVFVARELHKLPPVNFDHVDVTRLLKDIVKLQQDVALIKEQCEAQNKSNLLLRSEVDALRHHTSSVQVVSPQCYVNHKRGAFLGNFDYDSGPIGLSHIHDKSTMSKNFNLPEVSPTINDNPAYREIRVPRSTSTKPTRESTNVLTNEEYDSIRTEANSAFVTNLNSSIKVPHLIDSAPLLCPTGAAVALVETGLICDEELQLNNNNAQPNKSLAEIVCGGDFKIHEKNDEWKLIQRKRFKNKFVGNRGIATVNKNDKFKAAEIKTPIYIYNVSKQVSCLDVTEYIKNKCNLYVSVTMINMRVEKEYNAFKIFVPKHKQDLFLRDDFWPEGISYRKFYEYKNVKLADIN